MGKSGEEMLKDLIERIEGVFYDALTTNYAKFTEEMGNEILECIKAIELALPYQVKDIPGVPLKIEELIVRGKRANRLTTLGTANLLKNHEFEWILIEAKHLDALIHNLKSRYTLLEYEDLEWTREIEKDLVDENGYI